MKQLTGRVVTQESKRGIPDLFITAVDVRPNGEVRIGTVITDEDGRFDFAPLLETPLTGLTSIQLKVETPAGFESLPDADSGERIEPLVVTLPRTPTTVETFLIRVPEPSLVDEKQGHYVPTGLPVGLSDPDALVARASAVAKRRKATAEKLTAAARDAINDALLDIDRTEEAIRGALLELPPAEPIAEGLEAPITHLVRDGDNISKVIQSNVRRAMTLSASGGKQYAKLALPLDEFEDLRTSPGGDDLDPAKVEVRLFGPDPLHDELIRVRMDILRAECERRMRKAPIEAPGDGEPPLPEWEVGAFYDVGARVTHEGVVYECRQAHTAHDANWTPDQTPAMWNRVSTSLGTGQLVPLDQAVRILIDATARGIVIGDRPTPGTIAKKLAELSLKGGAADAPALFDFNVLALAFPDVRQRRLDAHLVEAATELHDEIKRAGGVTDLSEARSFGFSPGKLFNKLRKGAHAVLSAGYHVAERAAEAGYKDVADLDVPFSDLRIRIRIPGLGGRGRPRPRDRSRTVDHRTDGSRGTPVPPPTEVPAPSRPPRPSDTPTAPSPVRLRELVEELEERMREPYLFDVFAADGTGRGINYGVMFTYRQRWVPQTYQAGQLMRTITLAPREERSFSVRQTTKKSTSTTQSRLDEAQNRVETTDTYRDVSDIVSAAKSSLGFQAEGSGSATYQVGSVSGSWSITRNAERSNQENRQAFREAVRKATQEHRTSRKLEVSTTESVEFSREETGKLVNPNDELAVTYLFYELQRRYRVSENLHRLAPVILVAQEVPDPHEITRGWLLQYDWILHQALLDESFRPALNYLCTEAAGAEIRLVELGKHVETQRDLVKELKDQLKVIEGDANARYRHLERAMLERAALIRGESRESLLDKGIEFVFGGDESPEASRLREDMARDAYERAEREQRTVQDKLAGAVTALEQATRDYVDAEATFENNELAVLRLRVHVKQNILHYMQALWDHEQRDQRVFRLYSTPVPRLAGHITYRQVENPGAPPMPPLWRPTYKVEATLNEEPSIDTVPLGTIADLDRPLGYRGNYIIFPLRQHNVLTKFLSLPYADTLAGLHDPNDVANFSLGDLDTYVECLRQTMTGDEEDDFEQLKPLIEQLYTYILSHPFPNEEEVVIPSGSLFIEALPGTAPVLEDFKLWHRAVDVAKSAAEVRSRELENLRYAARILGSQLSDPEIQTVVVADPDVNLFVGTGNGSPTNERRGDGS